jgi:hypothetical protein
VLHRDGIGCDIETLRPERSEANSFDWEIAPDVLLREEPDEEEEEDYGDDKKDDDVDEEGDGGSRSTHSRKLSPNPASQKTALLLLSRVRFNRRSSSRGRIFRMDERQIVAMITTIIECLKNNDIQAPAYIAQRYRAHLENAKRDITRPAAPGA